MANMLLSLAGISILTGLVTEGVKRLLDEWNLNYSSNMVAGAAAVILAAIYGIAYVAITDAALTAGLIVYLIALVILSWLCAMVGYDKVKQAIEQIIEAKEE